MAVHGQSPGLAKAPNRQSPVQLLHPPQTQLPARFIPTRNTLHCVLEVRPDTDLRPPSRNACLTGALAMQAHHASLCGGNTRGGGWVLRGGRQGVIAKVSYMH
jgi:hypothetical protein